MHVANASTPEQPSFRGTDAPAAGRVRPKRVGLNLEPAAVGSLAHRLLAPATAPKEIDYRRPQPIPVRSDAPPAGSGPLPAKGYPQNLWPGAAK